MTFHPDPAGCIKSQCHSWVMGEITRQASERGVAHHTRVIMGKVDLRLADWVARGIDFYCLDHAYFQRGWARDHFRAVRGGMHLTELKRRPHDRLKKFGVTIHPWRRYRGDNIVIIPVPDTHKRMYPQLVEWQARTIQKLKETTSRPIVIKQKDKGGLAQALENAWCLVCNGSVAGVEAALLGVPVFAGDLCCAKPISAGALEQVESPELVDFREDWAAGLAYATWHVSEIDRVNWIDYDYSMRDHLPR